MIAMGKSYGWMLEYSSNNLTVVERGLFEKAVVGARKFVDSFVVNINIIFCTLKFVNS